MAAALSDEFSASKLHTLHDAFTALDIECRGVIAAADVPTALLSAGAAVPEPDLRRAFELAACSPSADVDYAGMGQRKINWLQRPRTKMDGVFDTLLGSA